VALSDALLSQALNVFLLALCNNVCPYLGWIVVHIIYGYINMLHKKMTSILGGGGGYDIFEKLHTLCQDVIERRF
jgi:hypothetical protein